MSGEYYLTRQEKWQQERWLRWIDFEIFLLRLTRLRVEYANSSVTREQAERVLEERK